VKKPPMFCRNLLSPPSTLKMKAVGSSEILKVYSNNMWHCNPYYNIMYSSVIVQKLDYSVSSLEINKCLTFKSTM
jgi:hypothetical protein